MRLTKHEHSCMVLEIGDRRLVIDPGAFTTPLLGITHVDGIVVTHEHPDHWTPEQLKAILERSPDAPIFGPEGVAAAAADFPVRVVHAGDEVVAGEFRLRFFGGRHAVIHESIPVIDNLGVMVNDVLFYGGDSFAEPGVSVDTLAVPAGAPWMKIAEAMDFVAAVKPKRAFPVHEMGLSTIGRGMSNGRLQGVMEKVGGQYFALEHDDTLDL